MVTKIINDLDDVYGQQTVGGKKASVTFTRGKRHEYLGMHLDFKQPGKVQIDMRDYVNKRVLAGLPDKYKGTATTPASLHLFELRDGDPLLGDKEADEFHSIVAKLLFLCKRGRPDLQTAVAYFCTRVKSPTTDDQAKLIRTIKYLRGTRDLTLTLSADNMNVMKWWVDAAYGVHPDMKSHTGGAMSMGSGTAYATSQKQKLNTKSSTEAELVSIDDVLQKLLWTKYFLEAQGYGTNPVMYQDNQSTMKLARNGRASSGKRTRHINIRYFFITDRIKAREVTIEYCPTKSMVADFFTKPLQGSLFRKFRDQILGVAPMT